MITFEQAREIVTEAMKPHWKQEMGTLTTLPEGFQDATHWLVVAGAREALVDGNDDFEMFDPPVMLVDKQSGLITVTNYLDDLDRIDLMTPTEA